MLSVGSVSATLLFSFLLVSRGSAAVIGVTIDENCHGTFDTPTGVTQLLCSLAVDPLSGMTVPTFILPMNVFGPVNQNSIGDVEMLESPGVISDLVRFQVNAAGMNLLRFYSETPDPGEPFPTPLSDVGIPAGRQQNVLMPPLQEIGPDNDNKAIYHPTSAVQPGFSIGNDVTYTFVSDTPEPSSAVLIGVGLALLSWRRLLKKRLVNSFNR